MEVGVILSALAIVFMVVIAVRERRRGSASEPHDVHGHPVIPQGTDGLTVDQAVDALDGTPDAD